MKSFILTFLTICIACISSCNLLKVEVEQPSDPLPVRAINMRLLTRDFAQSYQSEVVSVADSILADTDDPTYQVNALQWKIETASALFFAAYHEMPTIALLDTWILSKQMEDFQARYGASYFGPYYPLVYNTSSKLSRNIDSLSKSLLREEEYNHAFRFVKQYADSVHFRSINFNRLPITQTWNDFNDTPDSLSISTTGTLAQVFGDASSRMVAKTDQIADVTGWELELFRRKLAMDSLEAIEHLGQISTSMNELLAVAKDPEAFDSLLIAMRKEMAPVLQGTRYQWDKTLDVISYERVALTDSLNKTSNRLMTRIDSLSVKVVDRVVESTVAAVPKLLSSLSLFLVIAVLLLFGIPFGLGWLVGRMSRRKNE